MGIQSGQVFTIHGVAVDLAGETLRDGAGAPISLRPQAFAVLRLLLEKPGQLVTKDELMQAVWFRTAVTDDSLVQCIHEIRRALHDEEHTVLKTVPKQGYRLILPAAVPEGVLASQKRRQTTRVGIAAAALMLILATASAWWLSGRSEKVDTAIHGRPVIAVLPFKSVGDDPEQTYFANGISDDLITDLSKLSGVFVIARNSTWTYRDTPVTALQAAEELGARYVLDGTVRREGDSVRINAHLVDADGGHELWAERYDGRLGNVLALQDMVIGRIVAALAVKLTSGEQADAGAVETESADAYDAMLQGWEHYRRDTQEETIKAIAFFDKAIALDPDYVRAHAALAAANWRIAKSYWSAGVGGFMHAMNQTNEHLARALARPNALALAVSAEVLSRQGRYEEAFAEIARATTLSPNDPEIYLSQAQILNATGRAAEAEEAVRLAMRLDPRYSPDYLRALAVSLFHQERYEETVETLNRLLDLQPDSGDDYATLVASLGHLGRTDGVADAIRKFDEITVAAGFSPMTVQEQGGWWWYGDVFDYDQAYLGRLKEGLRKAGVPEGAGTDIAPAEYRRIMRKSEGEYIVDGATKLNVATARVLRDRGVTFIDVRAPLDFARGHVPGALNICVMTDLTEDTLSRVVDKDEEVAFSCHGKYCGDSAYASAKAVLWGFTRVYYFAGGFPAWEDAGYPVEVSPGNPGN